MNGVDPVSALFGAFGACTALVLVIVVVILVIVALVYGAKRERERRAAMHAYATQLG
ncbi:MAG: hypothetical protein RIT24_1436, partial [Planctomycetota bacterium]